MTDLNTLTSLANTLIALGTNSRARHPLRDITSDFCESALQLLAQNLPDMQRFGINPIEIAKHVIMLKAGHDEAACQAVTEAGELIRHFMLPQKIQPKEKEPKIIDCQTSQIGNGPGKTDALPLPPRPKNIGQGAHEKLWRKAITLPTDEWFKHSDLAGKELKIQRPEITKWLAAMTQEKALNRTGSAPRMEYMVNQQYTRPKAP